MCILNYRRGVIMLTVKLIVFRRSWRRLWMLTRGGWVTPEWLGVIIWRWSLLDVLNQFLFIPYVPDSHIRLLLPCLIIPNHRMRWTARWRCSIKRQTTGFLRAGEIQPPLRRIVDYTSAIATKVCIIWQ